MAGRIHDSQKQLQLVNVCHRVRHTTSRRKENHLTTPVTVVVASIHPASDTVREGIHARS